MFSFFLTLGTVVVSICTVPDESSAFEPEHFYTYGTVKWIQSFSYRNKFPISHYNAVTRMDDIECRKQDPRKDYILSVDSLSTLVVICSGEHYWSLRRHGTVWRISKSLHQTSIQIHLSTMYNPYENIIKLARKYFICSQFSSLV